MADPGDRIEAVMFDMDGTLLDSWEALLGAYHDATTEVLGAPFPVERADIDHLIQLSARDAFPRLAGGDPELAKRIQAAFGESYRSRSEQIQLYDGVGEMLRALREQGLKLGHRHVEVARAPRQRPRADGHRRAAGRDHLRGRGADREARSRADRRDHGAARRRAGRLAVRGRRRQRRHGRARGPGCRPWGRATASTRARAARPGPSTGSSEPLALPGVVAGARGAG